MHRRIFIRHSCYFCGFPSHDEKNKCGFPSASALIAIARMYLSVLWNSSITNSRTIYEYLSRLRLDSLVHRFTRNNIKQFPRNYTVNFYVWFVLFVVVHVYELLSIKTISWFLIDFFVVVAKHVGFDSCKFSWKVISVEPFPSSQRFCYLQLKEKKVLGLEWKVICIVYEGEFQRAFAGNDEAVSKSKFMRNLLLCRMPAHKYSIFIACSTAFSSRQPSPDLMLNVRGIAVYSPRSNSMHLHSPIILNEPRAPNEFFKYNSLESSRRRFCLFYLTLSILRKFLLRKTAFNEDWGSMLFLYRVWSKTVDRYTQLQIRKTCRMNARTQLTIVLCAFVSPEIVCK